MEMQTRYFKRGDYLMHQNECSRYMYIINSGVVEVVRKEGAHIIYKTEKYNVSN